MRRHSYLSTTTLDPDQWNPDDESVFAWDEPAQDPIIASLHVEAIYAIGDEDQVDTLAMAAQDLLTEAMAMQALGQATQDDVEAAWSLLLDCYA
jgi:hypothetical protein